MVKMLNFFAILLYHNDTIDKCDWNICKIDFESLRETLCPRGFVVNPVDNRVIAPFFLPRRHQDAKVHEGEDDEGLRETLCPRGFVVNPDDSRERAPFFCHEDTKTRRYTKGKMMKAFVKLCALVALW